MNKGVAEVFPQGFPHAIHQVLAMPLAEPGMSQANITRSVYMLVATGGEVIEIAHLMNSCHKWLLAITGSMPEVLPIIQVEPEEFDFEGILHNDAQNTSTSKPLAMLRPLVTG